MNMRTPTRSSKMARQIRSMYPMFFLSPAVCVLASLYFGTHHEVMIAVTFIIMALMLFPPMWMCYCTSKKMCEQAIEDYERHMNE